MSRSDAQGWADTHPDMLEGDLKDDVEQFSNVVKSANPGPATVLDVQKMRENLSNAAPRGKEWSDRKPEMYSKDGKIYTDLINASHTVMLYEETMGTAESDEYYVYKIPPYKYPDDGSGNMPIEGNSKKEILKLIREAKKEGQGVETIAYFYTPENSHESYVGIYYLDDDSQPKQVGNTIRIWNRTSTHSDIENVISGNLLSEAIKAIDKMDKSLGIKNGSITLKYKTDFPVKLTSGNSEISNNALIAPRIMDDWLKKERNKMIMDNIKN